MIVCRVTRNHIKVVIGVTEGAHRADVDRILRLHHRGGGGCDNRARRRYVVHLELEARVRRIDAIAPGDCRILTRETTRELTVVRAACDRIEGTEGSRRGLIAELIGARVREGIRRRPDITRDNLAVSAQRILNREAARCRCCRRLEHDTSVLILIGSRVRKLDVVVNGIDCVIDFRSCREYGRNRCRHRRCHTTLVPAVEIIAVLRDRRRKCVGRISRETAEHARGRGTALCVEGDGAVISHIVIGNDRVLLRHDTGDLTEVRAGRRAVRRQLERRAADSGLIRIDAVKTIGRRRYGRRCLIDRLTCRDALCRAVFRTRNRIAVCIHVLEAQGMARSSECSIVCRSRGVRNREAVLIRLVCAEEGAERRHAACRNACARRSKVLLLCSRRGTNAGERIRKILARIHRLLRNTDVGARNALHNRELIASLNIDIARLALAVRIAVDIDYGSTGGLAARELQAAAVKINRTAAVGRGNVAAHIGAVLELKGSAEYVNCRTGGRGSRGSVLHRSLCSETHGSVADLEHRSRTAGRSLHNQLLNRVLTRAGLGKERRTRRA